MAAQGVLSDCPWTCSAWWQRCLALHLQLLLCCGCSVIWQGFMSKPFFYLQNLKTFFFFLFSISWLSSQKNCSNLVIFETSVKFSWNQAMSSNIIRRECIQTLSQLRVHPCRYRKINQVSFVSTWKKGISNHIPVNIKTHHFVRKRKQTTEFL